jgi:hypothetical protein
MYSGKIAVPPGGGGLKKYIFRIGVGDILILLTV